MTLREVRFFFKDPLIGYSAACWAVFTLAQIVVLARGIQPKPEPIFLHYTSYLGVDFIGAWYLVYLLPFSSLTIGAINIALAYWLVKRDKLLGYLLSIGAAFIAALLLTQAALLARLN